MTLLPRPGILLPTPDLATLGRWADAAPAAYRFTPGGAPALLHNAHYGNTRAQLGYALTHAYNSVEGDVRLDAGVPVMRHDRTAPWDLTFEQWAGFVARSGKHLRVDLKDAEALGPVTAILQRLGVPSGLVTFNVAALAPWSAANQSIDAIRELRANFPDSWVTLNLPLPFGAGYGLAIRAARMIGGHHLGVAVMEGLVSERDIRRLRSAFEVVNAWNLPLFGDPDIATAITHLRLMGVNGMIDLRRKDDPLAYD